MVRFSRHWDTDVQSEPCDGSHLARAMREQTPKPLPASMPVLINQAMGDGVVLANTNSLTQQKWCAAGPICRPTGWVSWQRGR